VETKDDVFSNTLSRFSTVSTKPQSIVTSLSTKPNKDKQISKESKKSGQHETLSQDVNEIPVQYAELLFTNEYEMIKSKHLESSLKPTHVNHKYYKACVSFFKELDDNLKPINRIRRIKGLKQKAQSTNSIMLLGPHGLGVYIKSVLYKKLPVSICKYLLPLPITSFKISFFHLYIKS
jgi:predicted lipoprotein